MNKKTTKLLAVMLTAAMLFAGCSKGDADSDKDTDKDNGSTDSDYGSIKTIKTPESFTGNVGDVAIESGDTYAVITVEGYGAITVKLFPEAAPEGVQNFIDLAGSGYYTGKEIHRVVKDFMLQGGSQKGDGMSTDDDPSFNVEYNTNMRHFYGALCYANAGGINGSQFYIINNKGYETVSEENMQSNIDYYESQIELANTYIAQASSADEKAYYEYQKKMIEGMAATARSQLRALRESTDEIKAKYEEVGGYPFLDGGYTVFGQTVDGFDVIDEISKVEVELSSSGEKSHPVVKIVIESVEIFTAE